MEETISVATPRQLMWWKFKKHRAAVISAVVLILFYIIALFADFITPYNPEKFNAATKFVPPQRLSFINAEGKFSLRPGVYGLKEERDPETLRRTFTVDKSVWHPVYFVVRGDPYKFWGLVGK